MKRLFNEYSSEIFWGIFFLFMTCSLVTQLVWKEYHGDVVKLGFIFIGIAIVYRFLFLRRESDEKGEY